MYKVLILFLLAFSTPLFAYDQSAHQEVVLTQNMTEINSRTTEIAGCMASHQASWKWMPDPCSGKCDYNGEGCITSISMGCDCGPKKCFNQQTNTCQEAK